MAEYELLASFDAFYKRYTSNQTTAGGMDLVLGVPREDVKKAIDLADTDGEMLRITVERVIRPRLAAPPEGPPDDHFRVWTGQTDD